MARNRADTTWTAASEREKLLRGQLHALGLFAFPGTKNFPGAVPFVETSFALPVSLEEVSGDWSISGYFRFRSSPSGTVEMFDSSISISVEGVEGVAGLSTWPSGKECVARYDVEWHGKSRGPHLNIYQPRLGSNVHWRVPGLGAREWSSSEVLSFFVNELAQELLEAGWPKA